MRQPRTIAALAAVAALGLTQPSVAQLAGMPRLHISGYGTVGVVHSDEDRANYRLDAFQPDGAGLARAWSPEVDSRLGLQASASLTPRLSAVVQVLAKQRYDESYEPVIEWANVKYEVTPELSVRVGRVVLPIFLVTDFRRVGYANPWVRPPVEVYSLVPVTNNDGGDLFWRVPVGGASNTLQVTVGRSFSRFPGSGDTVGTADARDLFAIVDTIEHGFGTLRFTYGEASLSVNTINPLFDAFRQFGPPGAAIAERYDLRDRRVTFVGVGASYDPGKWFAMAEWAKFDTRSVLGSRSAWYVSAGHRFGKFTPYLTYARTRAESERSHPGLNLGMLPPPARPTAAALNAALNAQLRAIPVQSTVSIGLRWDVLRSAAVKVQYDVVRPGEGSPGIFGSVQPGFPSDGRVGVFSLAVDFVF